MSPFDQNAGAGEVASKKHHRIVMVLAISALATALSAVGLLVWGVFHWQTMMTRVAEVATDDDGGTKSAGLPANADDEDNDDVDESIDSPSKEDVLQDTTTNLRGSIEVVDVGVSSGALKDVLATHYAIADAKTQKLLVMTTGRKCDPCAGVDESLDDPLMQAALRDVRLVRVDLDVFREELKALRMPTGLYPAFFLLGADIRPIDAIHGGEWDDDVAKNIAPVVGNFVIGDYTKRRHPEWSPTTTSVAL